jgi:hypothetical protein
MYFTFQNFSQSPTCKNNNNNKNRKEQGSYLRITFYHKQPDKNLELKNTNNLVTKVRITGLT